MPTAVLNSPKPASIKENLDPPFVADDRSSNASATVFFFLCFLLDSMFHYDTVRTGEDVNCEFLAAKEKKKEKQSGSR